MALEARDVWLLYTSHFLSMWNAKLYEYASVSGVIHARFVLTEEVVFVQAAFPGDLLATTIMYAYFSSTYSGLTDYSLVALLRQAFLYSFLQR